MRILPILTACPLLISFGVVEGLWSNRWGLSQGAELAAARLKDVPMSVGEWDGQAKIMEERMAARAELSGYLLRDYVNRRTGEALSVLLVCGRPGPIGAHSPKVCYGGAGYTQVALETRETAAASGTDKPAHLWMAEFRKTTSAIPEQLRIFWTFSTSGAWIASDNPRMEFGSAGALYKLYVHRQMASFTEPLEKDPSPEFLRVFLPEVNKCLFRASETE